MPYPMESGMEMMAADIAPERSPLILVSRFLIFNNHPSCGSKNWDFYG
jgi:hypothetical protein